MDGCALNLSVSALACAIAKGCPFGSSFYPDWRQPCDYCGGRRNLRKQW